MFEEVAELPFGLGAHASAVICGHATYVTLAWAALAMALAVAAAVPLAWTVLAARRALWPPPPHRRVTHVPQSPG
ncbi:MAG: hypothetical protein ACRDNO_30595 [Trebonia sp.]